LEERVCQVIVACNKVEAENAAKVETNRPLRDYQEVVCELDGTMYQGHFYTKDKQVYVSSLLGRRSAFADCSNSASMARLLLVEIVVNAKKRALV
jgi:hypothetical protein